MFYTVFVPPAIRADFALFVDVQLSLAHDHNLVYFQKSSKECEKGFQNSCTRSVNQIAYLLEFFEAQSLSEIFTRFGTVSDLLPADELVESYDVWSFDFNPNLLVSDLEDLDCELRLLGCIGVAHLFPLREDGSI